MLASFVRRKQESEATVSSQVEIKSLFRLASVAAAQNGSLRVQHQHRATWALPVHLPSGERAASRNKGKCTGPVTSELLERQPLHLHHYTTLSCQYFLRVRMTRGSVTNSQRDSARSLGHLAYLDAQDNKAEDGELAARGADAIDDASAGARVDGVDYFD